MKLSSLSLLSVVSLVAFVGCGSPDPLAEFLGTQGVAHFGVTRSRGCTPQLALFTPARPGCPVDRPLMTDVNESLAVDFESDPGAISVRSSDPGVVLVGELRANDNRRTFNVDIRGVRAGVASVEVLRANGAVLDTVRVEVADAASMTIRPDTDVQTPALMSSDGSRVTVRPMQQGSLTAWVRDARGRQLFANDGVQWTVADTATMTVSWLTMGPSAVTDDRVYINGVRVGTTQLTARAGAVSRTITAEVAE